jgi:hypothetical protein
MHAACQSNWKAPFHREAFNKQWKSRGKFMPPGSLLVNRPQPQRSFFNHLCNRQEAAPSWKDFLKFLDVRAAAD